MYMAKVFHMGQEVCRYTKIRLDLIEQNSGNDAMLPFDYYNIIAGDIPVGKISIRYGDNFHSYYNGHIGFEVFESHRGSNYAYSASIIVLGIAKNKGISKIFLTCRESDTASKRIFDKLGASFIEVVKIPIECFFYYDGIEDYAIYRLEL